MVLYRSWGLTENIHTENACSKIFEMIKKNVNNFSLTGETVQYN